MKTTGNIRQITVRESCAVQCTAFSDGLFNLREQRAKVRASTRSWRLPR